MAFLDNEGVSHLWGTIKEKLANKVDKVSGKGLSSNDYTITDKNKLAGIETGANKYTLPTATASTLGGIKIGTNLSISSGVLSAKDTTYSNATTTVAGLMSTTDKTKLDGLKNYDDTQVKNDIALNTSSIGMSRKNLLKNIATNQEINGVAFTVNDDKTITANGTATAKTNFEFNTTIKPGEYIFSGISEPATSSTVNMGIFNASTWKAFVALDKESKFSVTEDTNAIVRLVVYEGYTADNVIFSPMIRYSDIIDDAYEPYQDDLQTQINNIIARLTALENA